MYNYTHIGHSPLHFMLCASLTINYISTMIVRVLHEPTKSVNQTLIAIQVSNLVSGLFILFSFIFGGIDLMQLNCSSKVRDAELTNFSQPHGHCPSHQAFDINNGSKLLHVCIHPSGVWDKHSQLVHISVVYSQSLTFSLLNFTYLL